MENRFRRAGGGGGGSCESTISTVAPPEQASMYLVLFNLQRSEHYLKKKLCSLPNVKINVSKHISIYSIC